MSPDSNQSPYKIPEDLEYRPRMDPMGYLPVESWLVMDYNYLEAASAILGGKGFTLYFHEAQLAEAITSTFSIENMVADIKMMHDYYAAQFEAKYREAYDLMKEIFGRFSFPVRVI